MGARLPGAGQTGGRTGAAAPLAVWPPAGARRIDFDGLYDCLADKGFDYGPMFRGLRDVWRRGDEVFALATLPEAARNSAGGGFLLHPALLDTVLHAVVVGGVITVTDEQG
ncbi:polyketide synthase dehydratase domain-containing protein [Streptomyces sp. NPDC004609]|uniref:polyketide synthase dehydratase domain-containing protein n=1 Tax=Streptomyces sp. NPDC004609 TaxID=3364704 RepID=UPI0036816429